MFSATPLDGLPPYGPPAQSFPFAGAFREGYVVEFTSNSGDTWIGNFATYDSNRLSEVRLELGSSAVMIVAGGWGYIVDIDNRRLVRDMEIGIGSVWFDSERKALVCANGLWFESHTAEGQLWQSRRISWDGFRNLKKEGQIVSGEAYDPSSMEKPWVSFGIDLFSGEVEGGSYPIGL
ncbi:MAG: hypothetical protein AAGE37_06255 [Pseudomonadota bacterium]